MKALKLGQALGLMVILSLAACDKGGLEVAKNKSLQNQNTNTSFNPDLAGTPYRPLAVAPGLASGGEYGGQAELVLEGSTDVEKNQRLQDYLGGYPVNAPTNIKLFVNLIATGEDRFGGTLQISFTDNGKEGSGYFTSGFTESDTQYNRWFYEAGRDNFHGVFEDFLGGLVLVIDETSNLGDGAGVEDRVGGSIWYKNYRRELSLRSPSFCWFVVKGPYDCRPWPVEGGMNTYLSVQPQNGYKLLGRFSNLSLQEAFNGQKQL